MIQVLILEDEIKAARELKELINQLRTDMEVVGLLGSVKQAIDWLGKNPAPDLVVSDIQLSDGLCFDLFRTVTIESPVIFCTAYDNYALSAFEANGIDYLLKPIEKDKLEKSLEKFDRLRTLFSQEAPEYYRRMASLMEQMGKSHISTLLVYFQHRIVPIRTQDISYVYSKDEKVRVHSGVNLYDVQENMDDLMVKLDPAYFFRANRQFIVHRRAIVNIERLFSRKLLVLLSMDTPETIVVSKAKAPEFFKWLEGYPL
jgi:two-component system response regulator LytT